MIRVQELCKRYGETVALDRLDFGIERGEILGLLGLNGAGKTSTLRILTGFMPPDSGRVELDGRDIFDLGTELRRRSGYLPEANPLYPEMTVASSLDFWGRLYGLAGTALAGARERVQASCGLVGCEDSPIRELSKGYRQRVGLAQALLHDPDILFLDEPTAGLDPLHVRELREMIRGFAGRKTVVVSTHALAEVEATCDRVLILDRGRARLEGSLAELGRSMAGTGDYELRVDFGDDVAVDWSQSGLVREARELTGKDPGRWRLTLGEEPEAPAALADWIVAQGGRLYELRAARAGLEEIFTRVVRGEETS